MHIRIRIRIHTYTHKTYTYTQQARRQLELNNEIAALMHKCVRGAKDRGGESESAMVEAGLVSRFQVATLVRAERGL